MIIWKLKLSQKFESMTFFPSRLLDLYISYSDIRNLKTKNGKLKIVQFAKMEKYFH